MKPRITKREKGIWRVAMTLARNLCVQDSDRYNTDDRTTEAHVANECAQRVLGWAEPTDEQLAELLSEAGIAPQRASQPEWLSEALNSGDGTYRP